MIQQTGPTYTLQHGERHPVRGVFRVHLNIDGKWLPSGFVYGPTLKEAHAHVSALLARCPSDKMTWESGPDDEYFEDYERRADELYAADAKIV